MRQRRPPQCLGRQSTIYSFKFQPIGTGTARLSWPRTTRETRIDWVVMTDALGCTKNACEVLIALGVRPLGPADKPRVENPRTGSS